MILMMIWVNVNVYLLLFGNELNLAIRKVRLEKLISDELRKETENFHAENIEEEVTEEHQITLDSPESQNV